MKWFLIKLSKIKVGKNLHIVIKFISITFAKKNKATYNLSSLKGTFQYVMLTM